MAKSKEVTTQGNNVYLPDIMQGMETGFENTDQRDYIIPRVALLQALSPQVVEGDHSPGQILNTATDEMLADKGMPIEVIFVRYERVWITWAPRKSGGGLVEINREPPYGEKMPNGTILVEPDKGEMSPYAVETAQFIGLVSKGDNVWEPAMFAMSSTQLKKARKIMTLARGFRQIVNDRPMEMPLFARTYLLSSTVEKNNEGSWFGWVVQPGEPVIENEVALQEIRSLQLAIRTGEAKAQTADADEPF